MLGEPRGPAGVGFRTLKRVDVGGSTGGGGRLSFIPLFPAALGVNGSCGGNGIRIDEDCVAVLPLRDVHAGSALWLAGRIEAHRPLNRLISPCMEGGDQPGVVDA